MTDSIALPAPSRQLPSLPGSIFAVMVTVVGIATLMGKPTMSLALAACGMIALGGAGIRLAFRERDGANAWLLILGVGFALASVIEH